MAKVLDITDKLNFEGNPHLVIKEKKLEVNSDAPTMLKVMALMGEDAGANEIVEAYELMFTEDGRKEIKNLKLSFNDLIIVIKSAIALITGEQDSRGEQ